MNINTDHTKNLSREDLEAGYNHLLQVVRDNIDKATEHRKEIRDLKKELRKAQTQILETESFRIGLNFDLNIHWWEYLDGTEGGQLIIKDKELIDYDGTYQISNEILDALHLNGILTE